MTALTMNRHADEDRWGGLPSVGLALFATQAKPAVR
jgi:hypothetical protein